MTVPSHSLTVQLATVLRMTAGWYWQQDRDFRFVEVVGDASIAGRHSNAFIEKTRWERPNQMTKAFWDAHRQTLEAHEPFYELEYKIAELDSSLTDPRWVSISGEPLFDAQGVFAGHHGFAQDITGRKRASMAVTASERHFDDFASSLSDWLWETDNCVCLTWVSSSVQDVLKVLNLPSMNHIGMRLDHFYLGSGPDMEAVRQVNQALENRLPFRDFVFRMSNGERELWVAKSGTSHFNAEGEFAGYHGVNREVTQRRQAELQLQAREQCFVAIFEQSPVGMIEWDKDFRVTEWNATAERIFGWSRAEMLGHHARRLTEPALHGALDPLLEQALTGPSQLKSVGHNLHKNNLKLTCSWTNALLRDDQGLVLGIVSMVEDLTEQTHAAQRMEHVARHDALTSLPNRAYLLQLLEAALTASRSAGWSSAVMMVNMDRFKLINDSLGHAAGDHVLHSAAKRLRETVGSANVVARVGGDEFAVLVPAHANALATRELAERVHAALRLPYKFEAQDLDCTPSIGVALFPGDGETPLTLLQSADAAMTYAKAQGRDNLQFFSASLKRTAEERKTLALDLRSAVRQGELLLHFQPQVDAVTGAMTGAEALVRWLHPTRGLIGPVHFIPIAEETGLIEDIGSWVLDEACRTLRQWRDSGVRGICMSVNLSALQLKNTGLVQEVAEVLRKHGLPGTSLELELTESVAMADPHATIGMLQRLRGLGVQLAIDDFGTGYSSLSYLKLLPLQRLKVDRSFVNEMGSNPNDAAICSATIALAHKLKLSVVAEGVETEVQRAYLLRDGCKTLQGYLFSRPVTADEAARYALAHPVLV